VSKFLFNSSQILHRAFTGFLLLRAADFVLIKQAASTTKFHKERYEEKNNLGIRPFVVSRHRAGCRHQDFCPTD
jgi:isopentenyldiphosphate isomerase